MTLYWSFFKIFIFQVPFEEIFANLNKKPLKKASKDLLTVCLRCWEVFQTCLIKLFNINNTLEDYVLYVYNLL